MTVSQFVCVWCVVVCCAGSALGFHPWSRVRRVPSAGYLHGLRKHRVPSAGYLHGLRKHRVPSAERSRATRTAAGNHVII